MCGYVNFNSERTEASPYVRSCGYVDRRATLARPSLALAFETWLSPASSTEVQRTKLMSQRNASFFHLHLVSDSTGETLITVARAVSAQYVNVAPVEHVYPAVRTNKQLDRVLTDIEASPGVIL